MSDQYQFQSLTTDNCTTHDDILSLIFTQFALVELLTLRLVSHAWNRAVKDQFYRRKNLTLHVICRHYGPGNGQILCNPMEMFYLEDIISGQQLIAQRNHPRRIVEFIGEIFTVRQVNFTILAQFLQNNSLLHGLIIYWKACNTCGQTLPQKVALLKLIQHSAPALKRFSFWQRDFHHIPSSYLLNGLCSLLHGQTSLKQLDFNLSHANESPLETAPFLSFLATHTKLTLGQIRVDPTAELVPVPRQTEGYPLRQLKLTGNTFTAFDFVSFRRLFRHFPLYNLTTVALMDFSDEKIAIICEAIPSITTLKLVNTSHDLTYDFTNILAGPVQGLPRLTHLILVNYHITPTPLRFYRLRSITHLTLVHHDLLGEYFTTEPLPQRQQLLRLHVPNFCTAILEQFPSLHHLNLLGSVFQVEETMQRLEATFPAHIQLRMIFEAHFRIFAPLFIAAHPQLFPEANQSDDSGNEEDEQG